MNRNQATQAIKAGEKITHIYYNLDEWTALAPDGYNYIMEDGAMIDPVTFWADRNSPSFNEGWSIYKASAPGRKIGHEIDNTENLPN